MSDNPIVPYLFFGLGVLCVALYTVEVFNEFLLTALLGIFGFAGVAGLRQWIESQGWKTYFTTAMGVLGSLASFFAPEIITPDRLAVWLGTWGIIAGMALTHAKQKETGVHGAIGVMGGPPKRKRK